jgi:hypothetical protein
MLLLVQGLFLAPCHYRVGRCCERMRLTRGVGLKRVRGQTGPVRRAELRAHAGWRRWQTGTLRNSDRGNRRCSYFR